MTQLVTGDSRCFPEACAHRTRRGWVIRLAGPAEPVVAREVVHVGERPARELASTPALALEAQAEIALAKAQQEGARGQEARARAEMGRWIGSAAHRPLPESVPALEAPEVSPAILARHPAVALARAQQQVNQRAVDVARQERKPLKSP